MPAQDIDDPVAALIVIVGDLPDMGHEFRKIVEVAKKLVHLMHRRIDGNGSGMLCHNLTTPCSETEYVNPGSTFSIATTPAA
jgi:hypothetical protein